MPNKCHIVLHTDDMQLRQRLIESGQRLLACIAAGIFLARPNGPVNFGEANAIDVESMGLYWHFVDIVWIVIFTAVYLLEYL